MRCNNCGHLMLKGKNLAESCWQCNTCKARYFVLQTHAPEVEINKEAAQQQWNRVILAQYEKLRELGFDIPTGFIDYSLAFGFIKEDGLIE